MRVDSARVAWEAVESCVLGWDFSLTVLVGYIYMSFASSTSVKGEITKCHLAGDNLHPEIHLKQHGVVRYLPPISVASVFGLKTRSSTFEAILHPDDLDVAGRIAKYTCGLMV